MEGIVLEGPEDVILEQSLCFNFQSSNNQAEYEAIIASLRLTREVRASHLLVRTDSQLVAIQIRGDYQTKDPVLIKYLQHTLHMTQAFLTFEILHMAKEDKARADLLARLANTKSHRLNRTVIQEKIETPSFQETCKILIDASLKQLAPNFFEAFFVMQNFDRCFFEITCTKLL